MTNKKTFDTKTIGFTSVALLLGMGFAAAVGVSADSGYGHRAAQGECDEERHEAMEEVLEDGDYEAWKELMGDRGRVASVVTEENFETFVEMHEAMEDGLVERAQELREDLGLGIRSQDGSGYRGENGEGKGMRKGGMHRGAGSGDGINNRWSN